jgi:hypothetical protein
VQQQRPQKQHLLLMVLASRSCVCAWGWCHEVQGSWQQQGLLLLLHLHQYLHCQHPWSLPRLLLYLGSRLVLCSSWACACVQLRQAQGSGPLLQLHRQQQLAL